MTEISFDVAARVYGRLPIGTSDIAIYYVTKSSKLVHVALASILSALIATGSTSFEEPLSKVRHHIDANRNLIEIPIRTQLLSENFDRFVKTGFNKLIFMFVDI